MKNKLIKNTIIVALGKFGTQLLIFLLLPVYTTYLTTDEYGTYDLVISIISFLAPIVTISLEESIFRFLVDTNSNRKKKYIISQVMIYTIISAIVISIITVIILNFTTLKDISILIILYLLSYVMMAIINAFIRGSGDIKLFSILNFIIGFLTLSLNILLIVFFKVGMVGLLWSFIIANSIGIIYIFFRKKLYNYISFKLFEKNIMKEMLKYSIPLVPNAISWNVINLSDRLIIVNFLGTSENGIYSIANKFPTIINTLYTFFNTAWVEAAAKAVKNKDVSKYYNYVHENLKKFLFSMTLLLLTVMPILFPILINDSYKDAYQYIPILLIATYFSNISMFYGGIYTAYKDTKIIGKSTIISAIINLGINLLLIKFIGIYAAAISTLISTFSVYLYRRHSLKKYIKLEEDKGQVYNITILGFTIYAYYNTNNWIKIIIGIIVILFSIYKNKEFLKILLEKFKNILKRIK